jgi:PEP-CTERM motif-containing protein
MAHAGQDDGSSVSAPAREGRVSVGRLRMALAALLAGAAVVGEACASSIAVNLDGPGVSGSLLLTYGTASDGKYPNAYEITEINGTFSDSNNGLNIVNVMVGDSLVPITHAAPDATNLLAPQDFSKFSVASGLPPQTHGALTYDNLFYPGGSPQTATDYSPHGGFLDIYGLMFSIDDGKVINFWSNGASGNGIVDYGVAVANSSVGLDYVEGGVAAAVPEPGSLLLLAGGLLEILACRRRAVTTS